MWHWNESHAASFLAEQLYAKRRKVLSFLAEKSWRTSRRIMSCSASATAYCKLSRSDRTFCSRVIIDWSCRWEWLSCSSNALIYDMRESDLYRSERIPSKRNDDLWNLKRLHFLLLWQRADHEYNSGPTWTPLSWTLWTSRRTVSPSSWAYSITMEQTIREMTWREIFLQSL